MNTDLLVVLNLHCYGMKSCYDDVWYSLFIYQVVLSI
jgi:hypothetical protein